MGKVGSSTDFGRQASIREPLEIFCGDGPATAKRPRYSLGSRQSFDLGSKPEDNGHDGYLILAASKFYFL